MDAKIINPFLSATLNLFQTMFGIEATAGKPFVMDHFLSHKWEITGVLGITGQAKGIVAIRLHSLFVNKLLEKSGVCYETKKEREELIDAMVGELVNIISGNAIGVLSDYDLDISVPLTIQGINHRIAWPKIAPVICVPFRTPVGEFEMDVCFKPD